MPLQGLLFGDASRRISRAHNRELAGFPVGQIVGRMDRIRPTQEVVMDMVEEWIATTERLQSLVDED
jgi:NAD(P)H-dependent flavin oxidoreductase YrpB (nitropropane dioxygenase family)